jgi:hypothetical protein
MSAAAVAAWNEQTGAPYNYHLYARSSFLEKMKSLYLTSRSNGTQKDYPEKHSCIPENSHFQGSRRVDPSQKQIGRYHRQAAGNGY